MKAGGIFHHKDLGGSFTDKPSSVPGQVIFAVHSSRGRAFQFGGDGIFRYGPEAGVDKSLAGRFNVKHVARDVVAIESALGGCIFWNTKSKPQKFEKQICDPDNNYKDQLFIITDLKGKWAGQQNPDGSFGKPNEKDVPCLVQTLFLLPLTSTTSTITVHIY